MIGQERQGGYSQESKGLVTKVAMLRNVIRKYQPFENRETCGNQRWIRSARLGASRC